MYILIFIASIYLGWNLFYTINENISIDIFGYISFYALIISFIYKVYESHIENHRYRPYIKNTFGDSLKYYEKLNFSKINLGSKFSKIFFIIILSLFVYNDHVNAISLQRITLTSIIMLILFYLLVKEDLNEEEVDELFSRKYTLLCNIIGNKKILFGKYVNLKFKEIPNDYIAWIASPKYKREFWYLRVSPRMRKNFYIAKNYSNLLNNQI